MFLIWILKIYVEEREQDKKKDEEKKFLLKEPRRI